jgi:hypothetical protein
MTPHYRASRTRRSRSSSTRARCASPGGVSVRHILRGPRADRREPPPGVGRFRVLQPAPRAGGCPYVLCQVAAGSKSWTASSSSGGIGPPGGRDCVAAGLGPPFHHAAMILLGQAPRQGRLRRYCVMGCAQP